MSYLCSMTRVPTGGLADESNKVGVREATVSRVLNGKAGVADSSREAVLTALDVLGYERPTQLRGERARLIGLVLPELQNPIFPALAEVIGGALAQRGFTPVLCTRTAGGLSEADYVGMLLDQHVSGVVFAGGHCGEANAPHEHYRLLRSRGIPAVLLHAAVDDLAFPVVSTDDVTATGQAYDHLASPGPRRLGLVVGYDDSAFMNCTDPPLTTVRQPIEAMGKAAVTLLVSQIENMAVYPEELLFEPELVVRGSTGRGPVVTSPVVTSPVVTS